MPPYPDHDAVIAVFWVTFLFGVTSFFGLFTNISLVAFAFLNVVLQAFIYSFGDVHHPEAVMMLALIALALSPSGRVLSVDAWLPESGLDALMIMQVHDELVFEVAEGDVEALVSGVNERMAAAAELSVALTVEAGIGDNWDEAH